MSAKLISICILVILVSDICSGSTNSNISSLVTRVEAILSSLSQEIDQNSVLIEAENKISDQRNNLDALQSVIRRFPSVDTRIYSDLQHLKNELTMASAWPKNCLEAKQAGHRTGITTLNINLKELEVWCDQDTDGGGWAVIIKRQTQTPQQNFRQDYATYRDGFGDLNGEHWLGLDAIHELTMQPNKLLVTMAINNERAVSHYGSFRVDGEARSYRLHVSEFNEARSTGGDSLTYHDHQKFTTYDHDEDRFPGDNCANWSGGGGWWFHYCFQGNPTGLHFKNISNPEDNARDHYLEWRSWKGSYIYLNELTMMIKPE